MLKMCFWMKKQGLSHLKFTQSLRHCFSHFFFLRLTELQLCVCVCVFVRSCGRTSPCWLVSVSKEGIVKLCFISCSRAESMQTISHWKTSEEILIRFIAQGGGGGGGLLGNTANFFLTQTCCRLFDLFTLTVWFNPKTPPDKKIQPWYLKEMIVYSFTDVAR